MATRDLARTVAEGGRCGLSKVVLRCHKRRHRHWRIDADGHVTGKEVHPSGTGGLRRSRLAPLRRWLRRQVGRPWAHVYRDVCAGADARTTRGWRLRAHVQMELTPRYWGPSRPHFYVDSRGLLRESRPKRGRPR